MPRPGLSAPLVETPRPTSVSVDDPAVISSRALALEREVDALRGAISLLHRIGNLVQSALELEPTLYAVLTGVTAGVGVGMNRAMVFLPDGPDVLRGRAAVGPSSHADADRTWRAIEREAPDLEALWQAGLSERGRAGRLDGEVRAIRIRAEGATPVALAAARGATVVGEGSDDLAGFFDLATCIAAPLRGRQGIAGVLYADNRFTGRRPSTTTELVFSMVADHAGRAIESAREVEELAWRARTDALTGLPHHGALQQSLVVDARGALAGGAALGVIMVDLDDFKRINDTLGHPVGDALLRAVAARIRGALRTGERVYRYGGEEFTVVLPGADAAAAEAIGERVRRAVEERPFELGEAGEVRATCSVGTASLPSDAPAAAALLAAADAALLRAKGLGKNRVERAGG